jgi:hypothetical protein
MRLSSTTVSSTCGAIVSTRWTIARSAGMLVRALVLALCLHDRLFFACRPTAYWAVRSPRSRRALGFNVRHDRFIVTSPALSGRPDRLVERLYSLSCRVLRLNEWSGCRCAAPRLLSALSCPSRGLYDRLSIRCDSRFSQHISARTSTDCVFTQTLAWCSRAGRSFPQSDRFIVASVDLRGPPHRWAAALFGSRAVWQPRRLALARFSPCVVWPVVIAHSRVTPFSFSHGSSRGCVDRATRCLAQ